MALVLGPGLGIGGAGHHEIVIQPDGCSPVARLQALEAAFAGLEAPYAWLQTHRAGLAQPEPGELTQPLTLPGAGDPGEEPIGRRRL